VLEGGCLESRPKTQQPTPEGRSVVEYNPMMGTRLDLLVYDEPAAVAATRWTAARRKYLTALLTDPALSEETALAYRRELAELTSD
jgi:hypothetical protein